MKTSPRNISINAITSSVDFVILTKLRKPRLIKRK